MIRFLVYCLLLNLPLVAENSAFLSSEKQTLFEQQQREMDYAHEKLRYNWLSPITVTGSASYDKSAASTLHSERQTLSASLAQDLFRSGGITYAIGYADTKHQADRLGLQKEIAAVHQQLINAILTYKRNTLLQEQSTLKLKNAQIEIFLKRKQYEAGDIDITLLNNALMNQSAELKNNSMIQYTLAQQKYEAAKLSDQNLDTISLPLYTLVPKEDFLKEGWDIRYTLAQSESASEQYGQIKSSYLPKLTLLADGGIQRYEAHEIPSSYNGNYYSTGLQLSIPFAYNASATTQEAQAAYLKLKAQSADLQRQMEASYEQSLARIESYQHLIALTRDNLQFYDELLRATEAAVKAGYKAGYDLKTLQNTKEIEKLEISINELNIQIELSALHYRVRHPKEPLP